MAENYVGTASAESRFPSINFAIGAVCPVRCEGCYNLFADTSTQGGLVTPGEIIDFAQEAHELGIRRTVISGGDPLSRPDILEICTGLGKIMSYTRLDTVGTSFLGAGIKVPILFKGRGIMPMYEPELFKGAVSLINIPFDGATQDSALKFRKGRSKSLEEAIEIARRIVHAEIPLGINTVVSAANIDELPVMHDIVKALGACQWRLFQFDPAGPNPAMHRSRLTIHASRFDQAADERKAAGGDPEVFAGSLNKRGTYCMVNDGGILYRRSGGQERLDTAGHITTNRAVVIEKLKRHVALFASVA